jgi:hypothetical protein
MSAVPNFLFRKKYKINVSNTYQIYDAYTMFQIVLYDVMLKGEQSGEEWEGVQLEFRNREDAIFEFIFIFYV